MARSEQSSNVLLYYCHIIDIVDLHLDLIDIDGRRFQSLIGGTKRHEDGVIHVCKALCSFSLKRSNDLESLIIDKDRFTNRVGACGSKEILNNSLPEYRDGSARLLILLC